MNVSDKLNYILEEHISASEVTRAFGFKSNTMISNMRKGQTNIATLHMEGLETHFNIPVQVFSYSVTTKDEIDQLIEAYNNKKFDKHQKMLRHHKILKKLEASQLIPDDIFNQKDETIDSLIQEHKKWLQNIASTSLCLKHSKKVFQPNDKLFEKLKGVWYAYLYPSNPSSSKEGIWEVKTTIHDDYSVVDYWGNRGYIQLGKHESMIIKESYDNDDLTIIRFANRQVPSEHFRFVIVSNQNNTHCEMVNFGFYSRKPYTADEAKAILGDIRTKQLKLDLDFNDRLNQKAIVPQ